MQQKDKLIDELKKFLKESSKADYASGDSSAWKKENDGSTTIYYKSKDGLWTFHDNFFGGEPYGGREIVSYKGEAVWIFVYYGWIEDVEVDIQGVYDFLKKALQAADSFFRGPKEFVEGDYKYKNSYSGDLERFSGRETIHKGNVQIYEASYMGGLVNQRTDAETA
jgi:hypothetical protein